MKYLGSFIMLIAVCVIIYSKALKIGSKKSQTMKFEQVNSLNYPMSSSTLPIHFFTKMKKYEITNRMTCLMKNDGEACMYYCDMEVKHEIEKGNINKANEIQA